MLKLVTPKKESRQDFELSLDEIAREGARRLLVQALNLEVEQYIQSHKDEVDENGRRLVVRNGHAKSRTITMGSGSVEIQAPRVNDRREGEKFFSSILPPYLRRWNHCFPFCISKVFQQMISNQLWLNFWVKARWGCRRLRL